MSGGFLGLVVGLLFIAMQLPQYARTMTCCGSGSWGCGVAVGLHMLVFLRSLVILSLAMS